MVFRFSDRTILLKGKLEGWDRSICHHNLLPVITTVDFKQGGRGEGGDEKEDGGIIQSLITISFGGHITVVTSERVTRTC